MANTEPVDAAMIQHLSEQLERAEAENAQLRELLNRPITVTPSVSYTQTPYQSQLLSVLQSMNATLQNIQAAIQGRATVAPVTAPMTTFPNTYASASKVTS